MNKNTMIIAGTVIIIAIVGLGGLYIVNQQSSSSKETKMAQEKAEMAEKETMQAKEDKTVKDEEGIEKDDSTMMKYDARYVEYSKTAFDQNSDKRRILYFYASWCPICRPADADFKKNSSKIPEDAVVIRVNYNDPDTDSQEKDLAKKYGITYQHTFIQIDVQGKEITKWNGGQTEELLTNIK